MKALHWQAIGAVAALGALVLTWRNSRPLAATPLAFSPFSAATSDLMTYGPQLQDATRPNVAAVHQGATNTPTFAGWGVWPFSTWGVPKTGVQSPSALPPVGIVAGQVPLNSDLITAAKAQDSPSVTPDPEAVAAYYAGAADLSAYEGDIQ